MPVELNNDLLVDLGGWSVLKEARGMQEGGCVKEKAWEDKRLSGKIQIGEKTYHPRLNLRSTVFAENKCNCHPGRSGQVCAHAIALCLEEMMPKPVPVQEEEADSEITAKPESMLRSLVLSEEKGIPIQFNVFLPPNLERAAENDRIMIKVEVEEAGGAHYPPEKIDRGRAYQLSFSHLTMASLIETWCGGKLFGLLQLSREKLTRILNLLKNERVIYRVNQPRDPLTWEDGQLAGVHSLLEMPIQVIDTPTPLSRIQGNRKRRGTPRRAKTPDINPSSTQTVTVDGSPNFLAIELPPRSAIDYDRLLSLVKDWEFKLEPSNRRWWLRDRHKTLNFLSEYYEVLKNAHRANFTPNFQKQFKNMELVSVQAEVTQIGDQFEVTLGLGSSDDSGNIQQELTRGNRYWESGGRLFIAPKKTIRSFSVLQQKLENNPGKILTAKSKLRLNSWQLADAEFLVKEAVSGFETPETWKTRSQALTNLSALKEASVGETLTKTLRLYQKIGTAWLYHLFKHKLAGILADEMGLGKTLQALGLIKALLKIKQGRVLVVSPAGLLTNWQREGQRFTPDLRIRIHHGPKRVQSVDEWEDADIILTSYTTLTRDIDWISQIEFVAIIADEAQHIKNRKTQNARSLRALKSEGRFLLTGTPIENSIQDLRSLFEFLLPGYLVKIPRAINSDERAWFHQRMRQQAAPYILRRTKKQVAPELPEKIEQIIYCDMPDEQKDFYESVRKKSEEELLNLEMSGAKEGRLKIAAFTQLLRLRQACTDPRLIEKKFPAEHSAKWLAFREILDESIDGGHRILVFSQFVAALTLLKAELTRQKIPFCYIDGSVRDRLGEADRFNHNEDIPVFLISLKAGGTGLNLTGADTVVHFDPWWNPAVEAQATDRAHRIGQSKVVTSIKLIVSGSVEEKVLDLQRAKADLLKGLFEESDVSNSNLSLGELKALMEAPATR